MGSIGRKRKPTPSQAATPDQNQDKIVGNRNARQSNGADRRRPIREGMQSPGLGRHSPLGTQHLENLGGETPQSHQELALQEPAPSQWWTFDAAAITKAIHLFPKGSAPGGSGLRAQHLLEAVQIPLGDFNHRLSDPLAKICSSLANGAAAPEIAEWLTGAPLFPIRKKDGGVRPIAVGEVMRRLVARMMCTDQGVRAKAARLFPSMGQFGVGIKNGAEMIVHWVRKWTDNPGLDKMLMKIDISNAYNAISREAILVELRREFPELVPWFRFCYAAPARLPVRARSFHSLLNREYSKVTPWLLSSLLWACDPPASRSTSFAEWAGVLVSGRRHSDGTGARGDGGMDHSSAISAVNRPGCEVPKCEIWLPPGQPQPASAPPLGVSRCAPEGFELLGAPLGPQPFVLKL